MKVVITGVGGFVGTNLAAYVSARGHEVWGVEPQAVVERLEGEREGAQWARLYTWERLEEVPWGEVEAVVHLAGKAHDTRSVSDEQSYFDVNVGLTAKVLEQCGGGKVFVLFSSVKAVADEVEGVLTEEAVAQPKTAYGRSKLEAERLVLAKEGVRAYVLRPCMIYGAGNKGNLKLLESVVRCGMPWPLGVYENRRTFAAIESVCAVVCELLPGRVATGVYQVADDESFSTNELVRTLAQRAGKKARIWRVPKGVVRIVARVGDVLRLPLNSERLRKLTESYVVANGKVKRALGWERMGTSASRSEADR